MNSKPLVALVLIGALCFNLPGILPQQLVGGFQDPPCNAKYKTPNHSCWGESWCTEIDTFDAISVPGENVFFGGYDVGTCFNPGCNGVSEGLYVPCD